MYVSWRKHGYRLTRLTPSTWTFLPQATVPCIDIVGRQLIDVADTIKASVIDVGDYAEFELLAVKLVGRRAKSVVAVCVYRSPALLRYSVHRYDLFDQLVLLDSQFAVVLGDFDSPGVTAGQLDQRAIDVFTQHGLRQHFSSLLQSVAISLAATFWT